MSEYFQSMETGEIIKAKGKLCAHWESLALQVKCEVVAQKRGAKLQDLPQETLDIIANTNISSKIASEMTGVAKTVIEYRRRKIKNEEKRAKQAAKRANLQK